MLKKYKNTFQSCVYGQILNFSCIFHVKNKNYIFIILEKIWKKIINQWVLQQICNYPL